MSPSKTLSPPAFSPGARDALRKYLLSHPTPCLHAFSFGVDALKSILLMSAVVERRLTVEEAVDMARLEVQVQVRLNQQIEN